MAYRQSNKAYASGASISCGFVGNVVAGNLLVFVVSHYGENLEGAAVGVTDSQDGYVATWAPVSNSQLHPNDTSFHIKAYYRYAVSTGPCTVRLNLSNVNNYTSAVVFELSGIAASNPVDQYDFNTGADDAPSAGPITTTAAGTIVALQGDEYNSGTATTNKDPDANWTQVQEYENGLTEMRINAMHRDGPSPPVTDTADWTIQYSANWIGLIVALKAAAAGASIAALFKRSNHVIGSGCHVS